VIINANWSLIDRIETEKWDQEKLIKSLGKPDEVIPDLKQTVDLWVYNYPQPNHQKWGFEISRNGKIVSATFVPNASTRDGFTIEKISQKWGVSCAKKKEVDSSQHFVRNIRFLDCGKNRRAYINRYDEVTSLAINIL
jgi:phage pi2 protein 07